VAKKQEKGREIVQDLKRIAADRAAKPKQKSVGASFETEHQRAKKALVKQIEDLDGSNIQMISATSEQTRGENTLLRVAAYCRVSTDDLDQAISIALQIKEYKAKIKSNPNWKYVGTYVDDGFSGTNTEHRQGFQKLMADSLDGKIDLIITKAVSRFARNLMDCIVWVEALQNHDPPIGVIFEQEGLNTLAQTSSIILIVLAMVAQEESHMKSEAILLSLEWRFSRGRFMTPRLFGYDLVEVPDGYGGRKKELRINEAEAKVVRWLYYNIINGMSADELAEVLTELAIPTGGRRKDGTLNTHWTASGIRSVLRNEKHCGDVLARKYYTPNYKDHKQKRNTGQKNKYFQANHHEAIVSRAVWNAAQRIMNSRRFGHGRHGREGTYQPMRIVDHGALTGYISMNRSWAGFDAEDYIRASQIVMGLLDEKLEVDLEKEYLPEAGRRIGTLMDDHGISQIAREYTQAEQEVKDELEGRKSEAHTEQKREEITRTFQVVSAEMFSQVHEPVVRFSQKGLHFNTSCVALMPCEYVEILINPVERMMVVRPAQKGKPNAMPWTAKGISACAMTRMVYTTLGWESDYTYRIPCQRVTQPGGDAVVLAFDLDNYVGRAVNKKEEVVMARREAEMAEEQREDAKSFFYPPEEEDMPQEIKDMEDRFQRVREQNRKIFGEPVFEHDSTTRGFVEQESGEEWEMLAEARPIEVDHRVDEDTIHNLLQEIVENPPELPRESVFVSEATVEGIEDHSNGAEQ
jgi:DNA invertase Pin-like site-specific DNA recombinase